MPVRVVADRLYLRDVDELAAWLERDVPEWLPQFIEELHEVEARLGQFPDIGAPISHRGRALRKMVFLRSPYVVWYARPDENTVRLMRLFHGHARRPREQKPKRRGPQS